MSELATVRQWASPPNQKQPMKISQRGSTRLARLAATGEKTTESTPPHATTRPAQVVDQRAAEVDLGRFQVRLSQLLGRLGCVPVGTDVGGPALDLGRGSSSETDPAATSASRRFRSMPERSSLARGDAICVRARARFASACPTASLASVLSSTTRMPLQTSPC
jgi:hypothetical protein